MIKEPPKKIIVRHISYFIKIIMGVKQAYYYLFYKFYNWAKISPSIFQSDFVAIVSIFLLEILLLDSVKIYYQAFNGKGDEISILSFQVYFPIAILLLIKYLFFISGAKWKRYTSEFDKMPKDKAEMGTFVVICLIVFTIGNLTLAVYLRKLWQGF